jgi:hypothetical protein
MPPRTVRSLAAGELAPGLALERLPLLVGVPDPERGRHGRLELGLTLALALPVLMAGMDARCLTGEPEGVARPRSSAKSRSSRAPGPSVHASASSKPTSSNVTSDGATLAREAADASDAADMVLSRFEETEAEAEASSASVPRDLDDLGAALGDPVGDAADAPSASGVSRSTSSRSIVDAVTFHGLELVEDTMLGMGGRE